MTETSALQAYLNKSDVKQVELARSLGVTRFTIRRWANGQTPIPVDVMDKLSETTGIPVPDLRPDLARKFGSAA